MCEIIAFGRYFNIRRKLLCKLERIEERGNERRCAISPAGASSFDINSLIEESLSCSIYSRSSSITFSPRYLTLLKLAGERERAIIHNVWKLSIAVRGRRAIRIRELMGSLIARVGLKATGSTGQRIVSRVGGSGRGGGGGWCHRTSITHESRSAAGILATS